MQGKGAPLPLQPIPKSNHNTKTKTKTKNNNKIKVVYTENLTDPAAGLLPPWPLDRPAADRPPPTCGASRAHSSATPAPDARCTAAPRSADTALRWPREILSAHPRRR